jgi:hypothetical protein
VASGALPGFNEERLCSKAQQGETETRGQQPGEQQPVEAQGREDAAADTKARPPGFVGAEEKMEAVSVGIESE